MSGGKHKWALGSSTGGKWETAFATTANKQMSGGKNMCMGGGKQYGWAMGGSIYDNSEPNFLPQPLLPDRCLWAFYRLLGLPVSSGYGKKLGAEQLPINK